MANLLEYKCPSCGGAVSFDSSIQKMKCPYCDTEFEMEDLQDNDTAEEAAASSQVEWNGEAAGGEWADGETDGMLVYVCKSCGGEIVGDETMGATTCPFCDNPVVVAGQFAGALKPDVVIPFQLDKKAAKAKLVEHLKGKRLLPKVFKDENHIDEVKGLYVPFWLFDSDAEGDLSYNATKVRMWSDSDYDYVETSHYHVERGGMVSFERVPVDGSSKMADDLMESIEPFDPSDAVPFQTAYLSGYLADKYDVTEVESLDRAKERIDRSVKEVFEETVQGYNSVTLRGSNVRIENGKAKYALYPVWLLNTSWNGERYTFAMNGQTGKFVGNLPMDKGAFWRWFGGMTALGTALTLGVSALLYLL